MAFRIKNTYQYISKKDFDGNYYNEIPQLTYSRSDDNSLQSILEKNKETLYVKAERLCFNNIFNIDNQNIYIYLMKEMDFELKKTKSLRKGQHNFEFLNNFFHSFSDIGINFKFEKDKSNFSGKLTIENTNIQDCKIKL